MLITDHYSKRQETHVLTPGSESKVACPLKESSGWYDLRVTLPTTTDYLRRFAGHVENGKPSTSDPAVYEQA